MSHFFFFFFLHVRRLEREAERLQREEERNRELRERESATYHEWESKEDVFLVEQAKIRSQIRLEEGRAKPIDLLIKYINNYDKAENIMDFELHEPYHVFRNISLLDLEDLAEDVRLCIEVEKDVNAEFWQDINMICLDILEKRRDEEDSSAGPVKTAKDSSSYMSTREERLAVNAAVSKDVTKIFAGKSTAQLNVLKQSISSKLTSEEQSVDVAYWETLLKKLDVFMARARLKERHMLMLRSKLQVLKQLQQEQLDLQKQQRRAIELEQKKRMELEQRNTQGEEERVFDESDLLSLDSKEAEAYNSKRRAEILSSAVSRNQDELGQGAGIGLEEEEEGGDNESDEGEFDQEMLEDALRFEPALIPFGTNAEIEALAVDPEEDQKSLEEHRKKIAADVALAAASAEASLTEDTRSGSSVGDNENDESEGYGENKVGNKFGSIFGDALARGSKTFGVNEDDSSIAESLLRSEASKQMEEDEQSFNIDIPLASSAGQQPQGQAYLFNDKYRPRKPRFFNRVHTGYDWNLYNRKHYDKDNPPPKVVQGYKFNVSVF